MRWHGDDEREPIDGAEAAGGARGAGTSGERRETAVRHDLAPSHRPRSVEQLALERAQPLVVDGDVVVVDRRPRQVRREPPAQIRHEAVTLV